MTARPFAGLAPADDRRHAAWVVDAMRGRDGVAGIVPEAFDACVRIHHPLDDGARWADVAPAYLQRGVDRYEYPFPEVLTDVMADAEGDLAPRVVDRLVSIFAEHTSEPDRCHFGLWVGWGELHAGSSTTLCVGKPSSAFAKLRTALDTRRLRQAEERKTRETYAFVDSCPVQPWWGGRDMLLFDGPINRVRAIGSAWLLDDDLHRRSPQWWWPNDRMWLLSTEIDYPWTYVAGSGRLIDRILENTELETVRVNFADQW